MESVRTHLSKLYDRLGQHHATKADHHGTMAECMKTAADNCEDAGSKKAFEVAAKSHTDMQAEHSDMSDFCADCSKACQKAEAEDLNKIIPDGARATIPTNAPATAFSNNRPVIRPGQPDPVSKAGVPAELHQFLEVGE